MKETQVKMLMFAFDFIYKTIDLPFRVRNYAIRKIKNISLFTQENNRSDSQTAFYEKTIKGIVSNENQQQRFRRIYNYREVLEHLDYRDGIRYLERIKNLRPETVRIINEFRTNDCFGKPRRFLYPKIGKFSPTSLRYICIATDLYSRFNMHAIVKITEIGAGYGGQISVLNTMDIHNKKKYLVFDLPDVQILIRKYLSNTNLASVSFLSIEQINSISSDLVISNFAFSELPQDLQMTYLEKVLLFSKNGYLLMNSGASNSTGRSTGKLTLEYLKTRIPHLEVYPENPLTGPDNYLIVWHESTNK